MPNKTNPYAKSDKSTKKFGKFIACGACDTANSEPYDYIAERLRVARTKAIAKFIEQRRTS